MAVWWRLAFYEESVLDYVAYVGVVLALACGWRHSRLLPLFAAGPLLYVAGNLMNLLVVSQNAWRMPIAVSAALVVRGSPYVAIGPHAGLPWLGDIFHTTAGYSSLGDMIVWSGELAVVLAALVWLVAPLARIELRRDAKGAQL